MSRKIIAIGLPAERMKGVADAIADHVRGKDVACESHTLADMKAEDIVAQNPELVVVQNAHSQGAVGLSERLRKLGYTGGILVIQSPAGSPFGYELETDALWSAKSKDIIDRWVSAEELWNTKYMAGSLLELMDQAEGKRDRRKDPYQGRVAMVTEQSDHGTKMAATLKSRAKLNYTVDNVGAAFVDKASAGSMVRDYDVVVIQNEPASYGHLQKPSALKGVDVARRMREGGYEGQILLLEGQWGLSPRKDEAVEKALKDGVVNQFITLEDYAATPTVLAKAVDGLMLEQRKKNAARAPVSATIGLVGCPGMLGDNLEKSLANEKQFRRDYTVSRQAEVPPLTQAADMDIMVVYRALDPTKRDAQEAALVKLRQGGYEGKIMVMVGAHAEKDAYTDLQRKRIIDGVVSYSDAGIMADIAKLAEESQKQRAVVSAKHDEFTRGKLESLERAEREWPEALRLTHDEMEGIAAAARHARDVSHGWDAALQKALARKVNEATGKSRWEEGEKAPRMMSHAEREQGKKEEALAREARRHGLEVWEKKYVDPLYLRANDLQHKETEQAFPYFQQAGHMVLNFTAAVEEARQAIAHGETPPSGKDYHDALLKAFATRAVDMLAAVKRLPEGMEDVNTHRAALEAQVVESMGGYGKMPMRTTPTEQEAGLRADEKQDVAKAGMIKADMPEKWAKLTKAKLGVDVAPVVRRA